MERMLTAAVDTGALLSEAGMTVLIGLVVVFAALLLLTCIFWLFGVVAGQKSSEKKAPAPKPVKLPKAAKSASVPVVEDGVSDEVVAAIAAAIAAMSDGATQYVIRRIRPARTVGTRPVWAAAGIADNTKPF